MLDHGRPCALVLARAPRAGECKTRLEPLLGAEGCVRLQTVLIERAVAWARAVAPGRAHVAVTPGYALPELSGIVAEEVHLFAQEGTHLGQRLRAATRHVLDRHAGPLLVAGTDVPQLSVDHAAAALDDLDAGCDVSFGPTSAGRCYLLAMRRAPPALLALDDAAWGGPEALWRGLLAADGSALSLGLLRSERDLCTPADARALLADPLTPREVARALAKAPEG
jgi:uncharacterized protein